MAARTGGLLVAVVLLIVPASSGGAAGDGRFHYEKAWALSGPCCGDSGHDISVEPDGSFFIVGRYGALDLDGDDKVDLRADGGHDLIVLKGGPSGSLEWVRAPRSPAMAFGSLAVAPDRRGGAYIAGGFIESLEFKSGVRVEARGPYDGLLARYSSDGTALWAQAIGGEHVDVLSGMATDEAGNVYVVGTVQGRTNLDPDHAAGARGGSDHRLIVASYDPGGALRWARLAGGTGESRGWAIAVSPDGTAHVAGVFRGADIDLDGDGRPDLPAFDADGPFIARFDPTGGLQRAAALPSRGFNRIGQVGLAGNGDLLLAGYTNDWVDLDADGKADVSSAGNRQLPYVARMTGEGALRWVSAFRQEGRLSILDLTTNGQTVAIGGLYRDAIDLDGDGRPDARVDPDGQSEGFIAMLDDGGQVRQVLAITGPGADQVRGLSFAPDGRSVSVTGFLRLTADFDGDGKPEGGIKCDSDGDIFWARYQLKPVLP